MANVGTWYFAAETLGLINEKRLNVYLTDGGHIENLGIYELLRRRCKVILAVDAEADPDMTFPSLVNLEVMARIDLGVRIELPWQALQTSGVGVTSSALYGPKGRPRCARAACRHRHHQVWRRGDGRPDLHQGLAQRRRERLCPRLQAAQSDLPARIDRRSVLQRGAVRSVSRARLPRRARPADRRRRFRKTESAAGRLEGRGQSGAGAAQRAARQ